MTCQEDIQNLQRIQDDNSVEIQYSFFGMNTRRDYLQIDNGYTVHKAMDYKGLLARPLPQLI